jgi:O-antigen biosynthesis protein WbqP
VSTPFGVLLYERAKRMLDIALALLALIPSLPLGAVIALLIKRSSPGPVLYWSRRVGKDNCLFDMAKFRTMRIDTPAVATHLLSDPAVHVTPVGRFLRRTSLDELPQLLNILTGEMSFVGPRPALFNQDDLITLRTRSGIHRLKPGLTGWSQVNGRDELSIPEKVRYERYYLEKRSLAFDARIMFLTFLAVIRKEGVSH